MQDIYHVENCEIVVDLYGKVFININGKCELRIGYAEYITIDSEETGEKVLFNDEMER